uniref:T. congolense-specific, cell surface-expressed gene family n=1 Tax=Trypanosoma congolense (strain IL3000) TaxID=1068625 RepID=G0UTE4_TRYCI|nr:hypothetical protein, unlikely [Trypanosoma congolense IL3000]
MHGKWWYIAICFLFLYHRSCLTILRSRSIFCCNCWPTYPCLFPCNVTSTVLRGISVEVFREEGTTGTVPRLRTTCGGVGSICLVSLNTQSSITHFFCTNTHGPALSGSIRFSVQYTHVTMSLDANLFSYPFSKGDTQTNKHTHTHKYI